jgi:hypothetical protein
LTKGPGKIILRKQKGTRIKHLMFQSADGRLWHYKRTREILPKLFKDLWFEGKFEEKTKKGSIDNSPNN